MSRFFKTVPAVFCLLFFLTGCTISKPVLQQPTSIPSKGSIPPKEEVHPKEEIPELPQETQPRETHRKSPSPRAIAGMELTKQAQLQIKAGKPDKAIRILERAVNLDPGGGENYYYLAEAWLMKGNPSQATEYNALAAMRLRDNYEWMGRIHLQKKRIDRTGTKD